MAAVAAANESDLQATDAGHQPAPTPAAALDPRLLMAARRGDSEALKDLLQLNDDDQQLQGTRPDDGGSGAPTTAAAATTTTTTSVAAAPSISPPDVILEVEPPPAPPAPPHDENAAALPARQTLAAAPAGHSAVPVVLDENAAAGHCCCLMTAKQPPAAAPATEDAVAAPLPPPPVPVLDEDGVTMEGNSLLHVVAACGDTQEYLDCAKMIVRNKEKKGGAGAKRRALEARNNKGNTPLHCAAGAGNAQMISCLAALIATTTDDGNEEARAAVKKAFLRMQNECGETALHQAVRAAANKVACIDPLMDVDPELACIPHEDGASPLYMAISLGEVEIARHLYVKSEGKLSYSGPDGRNVLHAAVHRAQALPMILEWLQDRNPNNEDSSSASLVSQLTSQRDKKQKGSTPLHLAASLNGWPGSDFLCRRFPQLWPNGGTMATLLLDANESTVYQADDEGSYPIHLAAWSNSIVLNVLLERCPDCVTLRDGKGRTFLHVAAQKGHHGIVQDVVGGQIMRQPTRILNAQDSNGDTALHYAVRAGNLAVFNCLLRNPRVRLDVANKDGMTPLDLSVTMIPPGFNYGFNPGSIVYRSLLHAGGTPHGGGRPELFAEKHITKSDLDKESKKHTEAAQVTSIVTALIATVTFASAFTLPGGYRSADDAAGAAGTPVLAGSYAFDAFILADALAFICSISATCTLVYAGFPAVDISLRRWYMNVSVFLLQSAARSLVAAFGLGLYLVVHNTASAIAACAIVFASSLYGNMELGRIIRIATTVRARIGTGRRDVVICLKAIFFRVLTHFSSYIIIFGLPAIHARVH